MFGLTRDAYYKAVSREKDRAKDLLIVLDIAISEKAFLKHAGSKKTYRKLKPKFKELGIKIGRDKFHQLLKENGLICIKKSFKKPKTDSNHPFMKYKNLIKDLGIHAPNQVWVSDITYIRVNNEWNYLTLITDLFSRKIVGFAFSKGMSVEETTKPAMKKALKFKKDANKTILHSDRGFQYCMPKFTDNVDKNLFVFSNTQGGDPYENAVAERVNGILKYEFDLKDNFKNFKLAKTEIEKAILIYNEHRLHWSLELKTPNQVFFGHQDKATETTSAQSY